MITLKQIVTKKEEEEISVKKQTVEKLHKLNTMMFKII